MKKNITYRWNMWLIALIGAALMTACQSEEVVADANHTASGEAEVRPLVEHEVTVSLSNNTNSSSDNTNSSSDNTNSSSDNTGDNNTNGNSANTGDSAGNQTGSTRVGYTPNGGGLHLTWDTYDALGVYIKKADESLIYAGLVSGHGATSDVARRFYGKVSEKQDGEEYIYVHPAPTNETLGMAPQGVIDYTQQTGELGSTAHLNRLIPLVWREGARTRGEGWKPSIQGYAVHLTLTMNEDPGAISAITLHTMKQGTNGDTEDRIFPKAFKAANLTNEVNNTLPAEKTSSMTLYNNDDYTDAITLTPAGGSTFTATNNGGTYTVEAYLAAASVKNLDVFRTKYNVKVEAENGSFFVNEYLSFPGQESGNANDGLPMLTNGKCYNMTTAMSKGVAPTVINKQYGMNSLLGMWNTYGKVNDPFGLVTPATANLTGLPANLTDNILGTADKRTAFTDRTLVNKSSQGSPTFTWTMVTSQIAGNGDGYKQADVTYNNINIVTAPTEVYVTFISEYAWAQNLLGYYHYPTSNVPSSSMDVLKTIIFPNASKPGHVPYNKGGVDGGANVNPNTDAANVGTAEVAPLQEYTTVQLLYNNPDGTYSKMFPTGTTIGFFMMRDSKASGSGADHNEGTMGGTDDLNHAGYTPRADNTLLDWNSWRLFTNTAWNSSAGNTGWWNMNCQNFFCSADVGSDASGTIIPGLALYGAKDDASHNYNYSFSAMIFMVSTSVPTSLQTANKCYFNIGMGAQVVDKQ